MTARFALALVALLAASVPAAGQRREPPVPSSADDSRGPPPLAGQAPAPAPPPEVLGPKVMTEKEKAQFCKRNPERCG